MKAPIHPE
jgi:uncharacterized membrane protein YcfT